MTSRVVVFPVVVEGKGSKERAAMSDRKSWDIASGFDYYSIV